MADRDEVVVLINEIGALVDQRLATLKAAGYPSIRAEYKRAITEAMDDYLTAGSRVTAYKSRFKQAATEAFPAAFYAGYEKNGGDLSDMDKDADEWLTGRMNQEMGFIDQLFVALKQLRDQYDAGDVKIADLRDESAARADGYANTLDVVNGTGRMYAKKNQMLTFDGPDGGRDACKPGEGCKKWKGKRFRAKTWISKGLTDRNGNPNFECGRWDNCQHHFYDDDGNMVLE